ncbi:HAAS signaling domain-containing protein [Mobilicoccus massiliensis]|uniref:HAAS signaling domain-containing protein n=1 Tax=Mobilicoccus massiliensis TaxID=1522310 RepID=UPI0009E52B8F
MKNHDLQLCSSQRYLRDVSRQVRDLPSAHRKSLLSELEAHIHHSESRGSSESEVLSALGTPEQVATSALESYEDETGRSAKPSRLSPRGTFQVLALTAAGDCCTVRDIRTGLPWAGLEG